MAVETEPVSKLEPEFGQQSIAAKRCDYVLLVGYGASGTKRVLKIFDLSDRTHCRCEPNRLVGSPLSTLPYQAVLSVSDFSVLDWEWDHAIRWAASRIGERDHLPYPPKRHLRWLGQRLQIWRLIKHKKVRRTVSLLMPSLRGPEWLVPTWLASSRELSRALPVLKMNKVGTWVPWLLEHKPQAMVVNMVRHPGGFLSSYIHRWIKTQKESEVTRLNRRRLRAIRDADPVWGALFGDVGKMSAKESELWNWRYTCTVSHEGHAGAGNYVLVKDEDVLDDPFAVAKRLYDACGLPWCDYAQQYLDKMDSHWREHSAPWRDLLSKDDTALVERILDGSLMAQWWTPDQVVSRHDYHAY